MNVLLIDPPVVFLEGNGFTRHNLPLGLASVGARLRQSGHRTRLLLPDTLPWKGKDPWARLQQTIRSESPDVVGITTLTATLPAAARLAQLCRETLGPDIPIVLGGPHATARPDACAQLPGVTAVVVGEGEETMVDLLNHLADHSTLGSTPLAGVVHRAPDGTLTRGPPRATQSDLDALPFPQRDDFVFDEHLHPVLFESIITLRGCPYRCIYCAIPNTSDRKTRYRSVDNICDEIQLLRERHDTSYLNFFDSVFTLNRKRTAALLERIQERGLQLPFACQTRADRVDPELIDRLAEAGCQRIYFGIESGHADSLARIRKKMDLDTIRRAVALTRSRGIRANGFFMVGFPWETAERMQATVDFALELDLDMVSLFSATPLPGTELWSLAAQTQAVPESTAIGLRDFKGPQINLTQLSNAEYASLFTEARARFEAYNRRTSGPAPTAAWPGALV